MRTIKDLITAIHTRADKIKSNHPTLSLDDRGKLLGPMLTNAECIALADAAVMADAQHIIIGPYALIRSRIASGKITIINTAQGIESMDTPIDRLADHIGAYYAREF